MELSTARLLFISMVTLNIVILVLVAFFIYPNHFNSVIMLSLCALGQSFINSICASVLNIVKMFVKMSATKNNLKIVINGFWLSMVVSVVVAIIYCFVIGPILKGK